MKKSLSMILAFALMVTTFFSVTAFAEDDTVLVDGVTFSADMKTLIRYPMEKQAMEYVIPDGVETIGERAFDSCASIVKLTIPDSVTVIGENAFSWCINLEDISIPESVTNIGKRAFMNCQNLTEIGIPKHLTSIGIGWFIGCESLTNVSIPEGIVGIAEGAFQRCKSLKNITLPDSIKAISSNAFDGCISLKNINIPKGVEIISDYAFQDCESLTDVVIPEGTIFIGRATFKSCVNMKSITIPKSMTFIEQYAFDNCITLSDVYYCGTKDEWEKVWVGPNNDYFANATVHYEWVQEEPIIEEEPVIVPEEIPEIIEDDGKIKVTVNGERVSFPDQAPVIENERILVPLRAIFEALGAEVEWIDETKIVYAKKGVIEISLELGSNKLYINNRPTFLDVPAKALNGRVMVPTRAIAEAFGYNVTWDGTTNTVVITY